MQKGVGEVWGCGEVCWGVGEMKGDVGGGMGVLGVFKKIKRRVGKCVEVWEKVRGDAGGGVGKCVGVWGRCGVFENAGRGVRTCVGVWGYEEVREKMCKEVGRGEGKGVGVVCKCRERCREVCWGMRKCGESSCVSMGSVGRGVEKCVGVWREVWGEMWGTVWGEVGESVLVCGACGEHN